MTRSRGIKRDISNKAALITRTDKGIARVSLTKGKFALIDARDISMVAQFAWMSHVTGYAYSLAQDRAMLLMHRFISKPKAGEVVDHINGDKLDNRRENLRNTTYSKNSHNIRNLRITNTSGHPGVFWREEKKKWMAYIKIDYKSHFLGYYKTMALAVKARKVAEIRFGVRPHHFVPRKKSCLPH